MPTLSREAGGPGPVVSGFAGRGFRVEGRVYETGLLLTPEAAFEWQAPPLADLTEADVAPVLTIDPEFLLLGTGTTLVRPPASFIAALEARGIGVEPMDSRAAARVWGLLRGEGRQVSAALLPL